MNIINNLSYRILKYLVSILTVHTIDEFIRQIKNELNQTDQKY